ncbi:tol-pal system protein YbgF [Thermodesulfobacteriota bacterium]
MIITLCSSCVSDEEFRYTYDQVNALKRTTSDMQSTFDSKLETVHDSQAATSVEIEGLKKDLRELAGRVEDNERLVRHSIEKDLNEQDELRSEVSKLLELTEKIERLEKLLNYHHEYLNLETINSEGDAEKVSGQGAEFTAVTSGGSTQKPEDEALYEASRAYYNNEEYDQALKGFKSFLEVFPDSELADNAHFWIGECFMSLKEYEHAIRAYQEVIEKYPKGNKVPNAMLRQAVAWLEIGEKISSKLLLNKVLKNYPDSPEAKIAEKQLSSIK